MKERVIKGVLFDMDGTLFDTEALGMGISREVLSGMGHAMSDAFYVQMLGVDAAAYTAMMKKEYGAAFDVDAFDEGFHRLMNARLAAEPPPQKPGLCETLAWLQTNGYRMAVASATASPRVKQNLQAVGIAGYFEAIVGGDMIENGKPHPEIFEKAAAALGLSPLQCLAAEDSHAGVRSAKAAGCTVVMVPDLAPVTAEMRQTADAVLPGLADIPGYLQALAGEKEPEQVAGV